MKGKNVAGVGVGTALSIQRKNMKYLALGGFVGTIGDAVFGYSYLCRDITMDYQRARNVAYLASKAEGKRLIDKRESEERARMASSTSKPEN